MQCLWFPGYSQHLPLQSAGECGPIHPAQTGTLLICSSGQVRTLLKDISRDFRSSFYFEPTQAPDKQA